MSPSIYQQAHPKQSILLSQGLFLDDELQSSIGVVEPDFFLHVAWKITNWHSGCDVDNVDRSRIAEARKELPLSQENGKQFTIEHSYRKKGIR